MKTKLKSVKSISRSKRSLIDLNVMYSFLNSLLKNSLPSNESISMNKTLIKDTISAGFNFKLNNLLTNHRNKRSSNSSNLLQKLFK